MKTKSNQQIKQNGRNALGLTLLVGSMVAKLQSTKLMTNISGIWLQANKAPRAAAALYPNATPAFPIYRGESAECERSFSLRHSDWIYRIRGVITPCRT